MNWKPDRAFFEAHKDRIIKYGVISLVVLIALLVFGITGGDSDKEILLEASSVESSVGSVVPPEEDPEVIIIDVAGAVKTPKVVTLPQGSRVEDAIRAAGGLSEEADLTQINRAAFVADGEKLYIPKEGEEGDTKASSSAEESGTEPAAGKVNLNTAGSEELETLPGIGPVTANKIVTYRSKNGAFTKLEDLKLVDGIGDKTFDDVKDQITL